MLDDLQYFIHMAGAEIERQLLNAHVAAAAHVVDDFLRGSDQGVIRVCQHFARQTDIGEMQAALQRDGQFIQSSSPGITSEETAAIPTF
jgi:hypothetical protein